MSSRTLADDQVLALYQRYRATTATLAQIAAVAGVSIGTLQGAFMRRGLPRKRSVDYPTHPAVRRRRRIAPRPRPEITPLP